MSAEFQAVYDGLVAQYGSAEALSTVHLAIIRRLATVLSSDDAFSASAVTSLTALLPAAPGKAVEASEWRLDELSDVDFDALVGLAARACALRTPDGAPISIAPAPIEEALRRAADQLTELTETRRKAWAAEDELHRLRSANARLEGDLVAARAALDELARQVVEARGKAAGASGAAGAGAAGRSAPANSEEAGNVVPLRPRTPQESSDCTALTATSDYSFLDSGSGAERFDHRGPA
jgi:hypothetical protein